MIMHHELIMIVPLVVIGYVHRQISRNGSFFLVLSNLPVTIMHEMAHFVVALLLGGEPTGVCLWPKRTGNRWILGSVTARVTLLSAAPTALAPLLWLPVGGMLLIERNILSGNSLEELCFVYILAYFCMAACILSWQDIKVAVSHPMSLALWSIVVTTAVFWLQ